jgi:hypothetical protein
MVVPGHLLSIVTEAMRPRSVSGTESRARVGRRRVIVGHRTAPHCTPNPLPARESFAPTRGARPGSRVLGRIFCSANEPGKLMPVRRGPGSLAILAVLVFQVAVGMYLPTARALSMQRQPPLTGASAPHCPEHSGEQVGSAAAGVRASHAASSERMPAHPQSPLKKHACCAAAECQCHCTAAPMNCDLASVTVVVVTVPPLPALAMRAVPWRLDQSFRPPIA